MIAACLAGLTFTVPPSAGADVWPRFRGENGTGISELKGLPTQWTINDYEWVVELPGIGHSSPVIWNDRLFVAAGHQDGGRVLLCLDARTGQTRWQQTLKLAPNHLHQKNSYGSGTPAVDGERVYVPFADEDQYLLVAYDFEGNHLWTGNLGTFTSQHGQGVSPIVYGDLVIAANDQRGPSSVVAFNRHTGEEVWNVSRSYREASYSTPMILELPGREPALICLCGSTGLTALDPQTGEERWRSGELPLRTVASPVYGNGVLVASCGQAGRGKYMVWVDPTGEGDVSESHISHVRTENLPYVPTPVIFGRHIYLWNDDGIACCVDMQTGENVWRERIGGTFSGSPVLVDGRLYCISEAGEVVVIAASPEFRLYGRSPLGDRSHSTPAVANGRMYLKGFRRIACLNAR